MPLATPARYIAMLNKAARNGYALPAINVLQLDTLNAAVEGFATAKSDGIVAVSVAAGRCASGLLDDPVLGAISLAEHAHRLAEKYDVTIAVHTDHCPPEKVDSFLKPLITETEKRRAAGLPNLFQSHMYDGSALPMSENIAMSVELMRICARNQIILEVECGVVGGEEDGIRGDGGAKLYTTPGDMIAMYEALSAIPNAHFMVAATFGNVHGVYKPGQVKLRPAILQDGQDALEKEHGADARLWLVFHGGSGSTPAEIREAISYGVIKMNIHTDTQYVFTRAIADHMFTHYHGVLRVDGEVGVKNDYLASTWLAKGRAGMAAYIAEACEILGSRGNYSS